MAVINFPARPVSNTDAAAAVIISDYRHSWHRICIVSRAGVSSGWL